jgi:energy-coupling factor transporter transmembrane protein EcfT
MNLLGWVLLVFVFGIYTALQYPFFYYHLSYLGSSTTTITLVLITPLLFLVFSCWYKQALTSKRVEVTCMLARFDRRDQLICRRLKSRWMFGD